VGYGAYIKELCAIRKPAFHGKETVNSMTLLPSFNFIGGKERMKLLRNFHLTKVKQNFFLFLKGVATLFSLRCPHFFFVKEIIGKIPLTLDFTKYKHFNNR